MKSNYRINRLIKERAKELDCNKIPFTDGITNPKLYDEANVKILFILKEAYGYDEDKNIDKNGFNHSAYLNDRNRKDSSIITDNKTHLRVSKIASCILNNFKLSNYNSSRYTETMALNDFRKIAWINVGKFAAPNGSDTPQKRVEKCYEDWHEILYKQIDYYDPDIIIFGNTAHVFEKDMEEKYGLKSIDYRWPMTVYQDNNDRLLINTYHPSFREGNLTEKEYVDMIVDAVRKFNFRNKHI